MNNYEFCTYWVLEQKLGSEARVLDYGCGAGEIVKELKKAGINAFGCDVFYDGGYPAKDNRPDLLGGVVKEMENSIIPFDNNYFDFVINNQVMEHVEDMDVVLSEINRVLKPGGVVLSLFPDKGVWREGHSGVPFLHWFPKGSRAAIYYAATFRFFGLGHHKQIKGKMNFAKIICGWIDRWTFYRSAAEIQNIYGKYFVGTKHIEDYWFRARYGSRFAIASSLPATAQRFLVRKLAGLVFTSSKQAA